MLASIRQHWRGLSVNVSPYDLREKKRYTLYHRLPSQAGEMEAGETGQSLCEPRGMTTRGAPFLSSSLTIPPSLFRHTRTLPFRLEILASTALKAAQRKENYSIFAAPA